MEMVISMGVCSNFFRGGQTNILGAKFEIDGTATN